MFFHFILLSEGCNFYPDTLTVSDTHIQKIFYVYGTRVQHNLPICAYPITAFNKTLTETSQHYKAFFTSINSDREVNYIKTIIKSSNTRMI